MKTLGYYNGEIGEIEDMTIPMNDRANYFGDGVYDATVCVGYAINFLEEHVDRFYRSAAALGIVIPCAKNDLCALLRDLVLRLDSPDQFVYWQVTRGTAPRRHAFPAGPANLWVQLRPEAPADAGQTYRLVSVPDTRYQHCHIKTLNLIPSVLAAQKAAQHGCDEAVFHLDGIVTECAHSNIHILKDGVFRTHPADCHILPGIARAHLLRICDALGIPVCEQAFTLEDLRQADEVIVSSSGECCMRALELDGQPIGDRAPKLFRRLHDAAFQEFWADIAQNKPASLR